MNEEVIPNDVASQVVFFERQCVLLADRLKAKAIAFPPALKPLDTSLALTSRCVAARERFNVLANIEIAHSGVTPPAPAPATAAAPTSQPTDTNLTADEVRRLSFNQKVELAGGFLTVAGARAYLAEMDAKAARLIASGTTNWTELNWLHKNGYPLPNARGASNVGAKATASSRAALVAAQATEPPARPASPSAVMQDGPPPPTPVVPAAPKAAPVNYPALNADGSENWTAKLMEEKARRAAAEGQ